MADPSVHGSRLLDEWWTSGVWKGDLNGQVAVGLKFAEGTVGNHFTHSASLHDVLPFVTELRLEFGERGVQMEKVFEAMNSSKPSHLEVLEAIGGGDGKDFRVESLAKAIASGGLSSLKSLTLTRGKIGDGHFALARALESGQMPALENLDFYDSCLSEDCCSAYETALQNLPSLTKIRFGKNSIGKAGAQSLGRAIRSGRLNNLAFLDLEWTNIADNGTRILSDAFQVGEASMLPNLKSLIVANSCLGDVGMVSLARALTSGRLDSLQELHVQNNDLSEQGAKAFVSALYGNNCLTVDIQLEWHRFPDLDRRREEVLKRNFAYADILAGLSESPTCPARFVKLYLCGNPEVGKTTLRRTLQRSSWKSMWTWERRPRWEKRTRGIQVSQFLCKSSQAGQIPITVRVWDMAGQEDYHLVHNAFFPALTFAEGRATTFVIVCTTTDLGKSAQELDYWLRYIASSCGKTIQDNLVQSRRHVLVVLNNIGGHPKTWRKCAQDWRKIVQAESEKFQGCLDIRTDLFLVDVRKQRRVKGLKKLLSQYSRNLLTGQQVPAICQLIQENLIRWSRANNGANKQFPILQWAAFKEKVYQSSDLWPVEKTIEAAAKYLNEVGVLIYIDKQFPPDWQIPDPRLVVLNPNWFCNEIVGHIFLTEDILLKNELLFRSEVDRTTGSISIAEFKRFFQSMHGKWSDSDVDDLIAILLWLGLCYKGRDHNLFIPALISEHGTPGSHWSARDLRGHEGNQWVMGFCIEHERNEVALAQISLWHRFQVEIAQNPRFNGLLDNDLVAGKYFMTFNVEFMSVLIVCQNSLFSLSQKELYYPQRNEKNQKQSSTGAQQEPRPAIDSAEINVKWGSPTFDEINIFVMPLRKKDEMNGIQRKQLQVDLAGDLVEILLGLWNTVCPGITYVHRVVWPWPVSQPGPEIKPERNLKVTEVQKRVQEHGLGREIQWEVGSDNWLTADQLLSKRDKKYVVDTVQNNLDVLRHGISEAVELRIFPDDLLLPKEVSRETSTSKSDGNETVIEPLSPTGRLVSGLVSDVRRLEIKVDTRFDKIDKKLEEVRMVLKEQKDLLHKLRDTEEIFLQDTERTCPKYIYLGNKDSGVWMTLKNALSGAFSVTVRLHFACEAEFNNYGPHPVKNQRGLDVSELKDWAKTILPWLKVTLTVFFISAKVAANIALPGAGLLVPGSEWSQGKSLSEGIASATGYSIAELDKLMIEGMGLDANPTNWDARELYGKSREAMTKLIGKLTPEEYEQKLGLRRVLLKSGDDSSPGIVWICSECFEKFRRYDSSRVREIPLKS